MISKSKQKFIRSLQQKRNRREQRLFVAEGPKVVGDILAVSSPKMVVATAAWLSGHKTQLSQQTEVAEVTDDELRRTSFLQHPQEVLAVFPIPEQKPHVFEEQYLTSHLCLALDGVQDPGNLGTIIRIADWFGIETVYCSLDTADLWNPKAVQATMGSIARVNVCYVNLEEMLSALPHGYPVYGMLLDGTDIYQQQLSSYGLIVMGNEGNGISPAVRRLVNRRLLIPSFPEGRPTADSLNVAIATAVTCAEFRRRFALKNE